MLSQEYFFFFQAEDGIRDSRVTGVQTCALPIYPQQYYALAINALAAGRESPANSAFIGYLTETYLSPEQLGEAWGISLNSWNDLGTTGFALPQRAFDNPATIGDLAAFSRRFAESYYRIVAEALHRPDPAHLYLGSRVAWHTAEAVEACARWCDVVSFNRYRPSIHGVRPVAAYIQTSG